MSTPEVQVPPPPAEAKRTAKVVSCPACGASLTLRALGQSVMACCESCRTQLDVSRPDIQIIGKYDAQFAELRIPLGARGTLRDQMFEVIGAMQRNVDGYSWHEYLLFNPYIGFRWLVYDDGRWNFGTMLRETPTINDRGELEYQGRTYTKAESESGNPVVDWVLGEFYWRVAVGDTVKSSDYVSPPFKISLERAKDEITWTQLEHIDAAEIDEAFGSETTATPDSVGLNEPNPYEDTLRVAWRIALVALALAVIVQVVTVILASPRDLDLGTYNFDKNQGAEQVYGPFTFTRSFSLDELTATAGVRNNWVELNCSLVNTVTGETHQFTNAFSYYYGTDSDGNWDEGGNNDTSLLTKIPAGTYNLIVEGATGDINVGPVNLRMTHDVVPWRNFWLVALLILAYPAWLLFQVQRFERQRWAEN